MLSNLGPTKIAPLFKPLNLSHLGMLRNQRQKNLWLNSGILTEKASIWQLDREKKYQGEKIMSSWIHTKRKVQHDPVSKEDARVVYDFWSVVASRPTGNQKDLLKKRVGKKEYLCHAHRVLVKTQTGAY